MPSHCFLKDPPRLPCSPGVGVECPQHSTCGHTVGTVAPGQASREGLVAGPSALFLVLCFNNIVRCCSAQITISCTSYFLIGRRATPLSICSCMERQAVCRLQVPRRQQPDPWPVFTAEPRVEGTLPATSPLPLESSAALIYSRPSAHVPQVT